MRRARQLFGSVLAVAALIALGVCAYSATRRVDGRSAAQWLAFVEQAGHTVSYHAVGTTRAGGHTARFRLEQGRDGRYTLRTTGADGKCCTIGYDGHRLWYANDSHVAEAVADTQVSLLPAHAVSRILGTGLLAGHPVVRLSVQSGNTHKVIAVDRHTGVMLAMTTDCAHRRVSEMRVDGIAYQEVTVAPCTLSSAAAIYPITPAQARAVLGRDALRPAWLPAGMGVAKTYHAPCCCNPRGMVIVRYSDGVSTLALFQTSGCNCAMGTGCMQAPSGAALEGTRTFGKVKVTAVGTLEAGAIHRVLESLR